MYPNQRLPQTADDIARYFNAASLPSQQETLGQVIMEILHAGHNINRKAICTKLLRRLETASTEEEERHYRVLISLLFGR
ncbi:regulatory protein YcgZ [Pantoea sp. C2G6]|uniref:regulatory protein YcgZ n=1 Tax=Pantoea sp. C2G6 TaxID=3243084 RepID=UPI003ED943EE